MEAERTSGMESCLLIGGLIMLVAVTGGMLTRSRKRGTPDPSAEPEGNERAFEYDSEGRLLRSYSSGEGSLVDIERPAAGK